MGDESRPLEAMSCEELLQELARLTSEHDHMQSQVGAPSQAGPAQSPHVDRMIDQSQRMDRIGELLKSKGCE